MTTLSFLCNFQSPFPEVEGEDITWQGSKNGRASVGFRTPSSKRSTKTFLKPSEVTRIEKKMTIAKLTSEYIYNY